MTLLSAPRNHWLYSLIPFKRYWVTWRRVTSSGIVAWIESSPSSMKFDLRNHPSDVVLLVIESAQLPSLSDLTMMLMQGVMIAAVAAAAVVSTTQQQQRQPATMTAETMTMAANVVAAATTMG